MDPSSFNSFSVDALAKFLRKKEFQDGILESLKGTYAISSVFLVVISFREAADLEMAPFLNGGNILAINYNFRNMENILHWFRVRINISFAVS